MMDTRPRPARILVVDDASFMRRYLREILEGAGHRVVAEAVDGTEVLDLYESHRPDLVTLDVVMPRKSGIEVLRELRESHREAKVIICSSIAQEPSIIEALSLGARDYVLKPVSEEKLLEAVEKALR
jgi:two-component system chemotaxis response regulator CheY